MSKKYCFIINNPKKKTFNKQELENFVRDIYNNNSEDPSKLSFITFYSYASDSICIQMKGRGKALIENIEKTNSILKDTDLQWKDNIYLSKPYVPNDRQVLSFEVTLGRKWDSIIQRGPYFSEIMEPYEHLGASLWLKSNPRLKYKLNPKEEKIARFYVKRMVSEAGDNITVRYTTTKESDTKEQKEAFKIFNINFWEDFKTYLSPEAKKILITEPEPKLKTDPETKKTYIDEVSTNFLNIDWSDLIKLHLIQIEKNKENAKDKDRKAKQVAEKMAEYGYATINDVPLQKLANFSVEPSGIFFGRGVNPLVGKIKKEVLPEDVTLNIGENDPIPDPPLGHQWGKDKIVHKHDLEWVASWKDNVTGRIKYVWFSQEGAFKAQSDIKKYEKARKLHSQINLIREAYMNDAKSTNSTKLQLSTVLYLIDHFGIRVGNEKDEDEAETVGATTLLVGNVNLVTKNHVIFDFLGKDSVRFYKDLEVESVIFENFKKLTEGKPKNKEIFHQIKSEDINEYLKKFDKDFSAKVFRTRLASDIMYHALKGVKIPDKSTNKLIKLNFNKANAEVAEVLNHARTPSKKAKEALEKLRTELAEATIKEDTKKIQTLTENIESKKNVLTVAINTSLANYIDPRLVVSWTKTQKVEPSAIYTKTLLNKFKWAVESTEDGWDWENSPLVEDIDEEDKKKPSRPAPSAGKSAKRTPPVRAPPSDVKSAKRTPPERAPPSAGKNTIKRPPAPEPQSIAKITTRTPSIAVKSAKRTPEQDRFFRELRSDRIKDYELLLELCENLDKHKDNIKQVNPDVLDWIYPFCKEAVERGVDAKATKFIVAYYERNLLKRPEEDTHVAENVRKPPDEDTPAQKKKIQTAKIQKAPRTNYIVPSDDVDFIFLNTHNNEGILRKYCKKHTIPIKPEHNIDQIKLVIIKFYKDNPAKPIMWD
jgi:DNA topoisomerase-1